MRPPDDGPTLMQAVTRPLSTRVSGSPRASRVEVAKSRRIPESKRRRCIFCGRAKGDLVDPRDPSSRRLTMSEEHLFRESWQDKISLLAVSSGQ